jgi:ABC-type Fe3+ transport system substrate-binding protein
VRLILISLLLLAPFFARAETEAELVQKARAEKVVNVAGNQMLTNKIVVAAFRKKFPFLHVHVIDFEAINAKYRFYHLFESDTPGERGDVVLRAADKDLDEWIGHGWLAKIDDLPLWPERSIEDAKGPYYAYYVGMVHGLAYNPASVAEKDLPKNYDELLDPKWKGRIVVRSPLKGVSAATLTSFIKDTRGLDWFRRFGANRPYVVQSYIEQHRLLQVGEYPIALSRDLEVESYAEQLWGERHAHSKVKFAPMRDELPYQYMLAAVNSRAFHPNAARLFVNFLMSREVADLLEKKGYSAGTRRRHQLAGPKVWQWDMAGVKSMYEYQSYVAHALRLLRDGGAKIQGVMRHGSPAIE